MNIPNATYAWQIFDDLSNSFDTDRCEMKYRDLADHIFTLQREIKEKDLQLKSKIEKERVFILKDLPTKSQAELEVDFSITKLNEKLNAYVLELKHEIGKLQNDKRLLPVKLKHHCNSVYDSYNTASSNTFASGITHAINKLKEIT